MGVRKNRTAKSAMGAVVQRGVRLIPKRPPVPRGQVCMMLAGKSYTR
jgi:hypothetical protein